MSAPLAIFGIENDGVNLAINLLILFLVVVYIALIAYTYLDARRRLDDPVLVGCATVAALFPFLGTIVYSILRPPEFLEDRRERELEIRASELRVRQLEETSCPNCEHPVERTFLRCPNCRARIKDPCDSCGKPVDPRWSICPYCETPTRKATSERPPSRRSGAKRSSSARSAERPKRSSKAARAGDSKQASERSSSRTSERSKRSSSESRSTTRRTSERSKSSPRSDSSDK